LELAKVYIEENNLSKLSAFLFLFESFARRRIFAHDGQNLQTNFGYSIVKYRKNEKER
jgi:hypothetical protein